MRFNHLGDPWPQHFCGGDDLPKGWDAIKKLQKMDVKIDDRVLEYAFGKKVPKKQAPPPIVKVEPTHDTTHNIILVLREVQPASKQLKQIKELGPLGLGVLDLSKTKELVQLTFHDTTEAQAKSYTCLISGEHQPSKSDIGKLFGITISGYHLGSLKIWLATGIADIGGAGV